MALIDDLKSKVASSLAEASGLEVSSGSLEYPEDAANGDLAFPCFQLAKALKKAPPQIAADLASHLKLPEFFSNVEAKGPYLNFFLDREKFLAAALEAPPSAKASGGKKFMVEYVSPNNNKPLHLGHLRNGLIGEAVSNLLASQGHEVVRTLILNDRGMAIAKAMVAYAKWGEGKTPESAGMKGDHFVAEWYVLFDKKTKEGVAGLEDEAHEVVRKWEANDPETRALWRTLNDWCEKGQHETYKRLGFRFDIEDKESDIYLSGKEIVEEGLKKGVFQKDEAGAVVAKLEAHGLPDKVVLRADGTAVYITQDLSLAEKRLKAYAADELIYVVGNEQNLQFRQLFKILDLLNPGTADKAHHLSYGYVSLPEGRMKSREGTVVDADDLATELETEAAMEIKQRHPTLPDDELVRRAHQVAMAAVKFYFLEVDIASDMTYDPKASLSFTGRTGPYLQYMHARIRSILRKAEEPSEPSEEGRHMSDDEHQLAIAIARYPETVAHAAAQLRPSLVALHLYDLAKVFSGFYERNQVVNASKQDRVARVALVSAVASVLKDGLALLGIHAPEEM